MAWRPTHCLIEGGLDNTRLGKVTGWMRFAGMNDKVTFDLEGDFHRDIRGAKIRFTGDATETDPPTDAKEYMAGFALHHTGKVGDMTAGLPPADYVAGYCYLEWYSEENGRVVIELESTQVEVIGTPIPVRESYPVSRDTQKRNMAQFLDEIAAETNPPAERVVCVSGDTTVTADRRTASDRVRGMELLTQEIRKTLPPLYAQDGKGGKAIAYLKYFTPSSSWTWYIVEGSPIEDQTGVEVDFRFFGLVDGLEKELGYVALSELESVRGPMGLPIERDLYWKPKTLEEIAPEVFRSDTDREGR